MMMNSMAKKYGGRAVIFAALFLLLLPVHAGAVIDGVTDTSATPTFNLTASAGYISTAEGNSVFIWGYGETGGMVQYPGPTMIVNQGAMVTINLTNSLPVPVSIVFPGHQVSATGDVQGLLTSEALASGGTASYTFEATEPGTYMYHSGTQPDLQIEMGLVGAIIVRPTGFDPASPTVYGGAGSEYDHEYLFLLTEMDPYIHELVEFGMMDQVDTSAFFPVYWFINGRTAPDTMVAAGVPWLPTQPYNCMPRMHPGEKLLLRMVVAGRDLHPYHTHGNNFWMIGKEGRLLESGGGPAGVADIAESNFTLKSIPGETAEAIFEWTGKGLGWDVYGDPADPAFAHSCNDGDLDGFDDTTSEYCDDHGKPIPVALPDQKDLTFGGFWSGSPFLGALASLPPGEGGLNAYGGLVYMWHSHTEKEMTNFDIFPGGMMTMLIVEPHSAPIP